MPRWKHITTLTAALGLCAGSAFAQNQPTLDELLNLKPADAKPDSKSAPDDKAGPTIDPDAAKEITARQGADAFVQAISEMREAAELLGKRRTTGLSTQRVQESVLSKLDMALKAAENACNKSGSSSSSSSGSASQQARPSDSGTPGSPGQQKPGTPGQQGQTAQSSQGKQGQRPGAQQHDPNANPADPQGGAGQTGPLDQTRAEWGGLPPRLRDQLTEGLSEPYSPLYQELTEAYYRRLAEEP